MADWTEVVTRHGPAVWQTVYRILGHHADAQDCYQEVFFEACRLEGTVVIRDWGAFLRTLATRRAIDRLRQLIRVRELSVALEHVPARAASEDTAADQLVAAELIAAVRSAMTSLPDKQSEVFWLSCIEQLSHDEIAVQLRTTPGAVRVLLHRARSALAGLLANKTPCEDQHGT